MHRIDPVRDPARAPHVLPLHPARRGALLGLTRLVQRRDHQPTAPRAARRCVQAGGHEPADLTHRGHGVPDRPVQQPLRPVRRPVPGMLSDGPPIALRYLTDQRRYISARVLPRLRPHEARPQPPQQLGSCTHRTPSLYPGSSSRLRFCCPHKHMIDRRLRPRHTTPPHPARSDRQWRLPY